MKTGSRLRISYVLALGLFLGACGGDDSNGEVATPSNTPAPAPAAENLRVTSLDLGKSLDTNRRVASTTNEFAPMDTIYASVMTQGNANSGSLTARWTFQDGQVVDETTQPISSTMTSATEFHISKPDGFPTGSYNVEILLNGESADREDFTVR